MTRTPMTFLLLAFTCVCLEAYGYTYMEFLNTTDGFCEGPGYGRIPVGGRGYDDGNCEKVLCHEGEREVIGCGKVLYDEDDPSCELVDGKGHHPHCCPVAVCGGK